MALSTLAKEEENFLRYAILIVDHSKTALTDLLELNLRNKHLTFKQFLDQNQHEIYHLCYDSKCCKCHTSPPRRKRIIYPSQLELLFDKHKCSSHTGKHCTDFCCSKSKVSITTEVLDISLARCLLVNCCLDVFWFTCLTAQGKTLEQFLNSNKHIIYHLWKNNQSCCQCKPRFIYPCNYSVMTATEWNNTFKTMLVPCASHRKRSTCGSTTFCTFAAKPGIALKDIDIRIQGNILKYCCPIRKDVECLVEHRNKDYGHIKTASLSDVDFNDFSNETVDCLLNIARMCGKEQDVQDVKRYFRSRPVDATLCSHYQNTLLETINRNESISENVVSEHIKTRKKVSCNLRKIEDRIESLETSSTEMKAEVQGLRKLITDCSKRSQVIRETLAEIDYHRKDQTYTEIKAVTACVQMLDNCKVLILSGGEGSGKSKNSLEILRQMKEKHQEIDVIKLNRLTQLTDVMDSDKQTIVLFEDVFGRVSKQFCENRDMRILQTLHSYIMLDYLKVVFIIRNDIKHECKNIMSKHEIFNKNVGFVDLDSDAFQLSHKEKERLFINNCTNNGIEIIHREKIQHLWYHTPNRNELKTEPECRVSVEGKEMYFDAEAVQDIIRSAPYHGFPQCCRLFTNNRKFTLLGATFFKYPFKSLLQEIENMRLEGMDNDAKGLKYVILVYILLNNSSPTVTANVFGMHSMHYLQYEQNILSVNENKIDVQAHQKLFNECYNKTFRPKVHNIIDLYEKLTTKYLIRKQNKIYFQHRALRDSVLISYSKTNANAIIPLLSMDHMTDIVRTQNYMEQEEEVVIKISKSYYPELAAKIISLMNSELYYRKYRDRFMESKIITDDDVDLIYELLSCINNRIDTLDSYTHHYFPLYLLLRIIGKLDDNELTVNHTKDQLLISVTIGYNNISFGVDPNISLICAMQSKYIDTIKWLFKNTDHTLMDFKQLCFIRDINVYLTYIQLLFENVKHEMLDMTQLFTNMLFSNEKEHAIDLIVNNVDNSLICYDKCISNILEKIYHDFPCDLIVYILKKVNHKWLNISNIVKKTCQHGFGNDLLKVLQNVDLELLDKEELINSLIPFNEGDENCLKKIVELILPWINDSDCNRLVEQADFYRFYGLLELLITHFNDLSIDIVRLIENFSKWWDTAEDMDGEYDDDHIENVLRLLLKHHFDKIGVADIIMEKACHVGSHCIVEDLLMDKNHNICYYLNITLDTCLSRRLNELSVSNYGGYGKLLMLFIQKVDFQFIDLNSLMSDVCNIGHSSAVLWLLENKHSHCFDLRNVMNKASYHADPGLIEYLYQNYKAEDFDYKTAMIKACRNSQEKTLDVCKWLWANIDRHLFDMKVALNNASRYNNTAVVEWILKDVDAGLFDTESAIYCACENGEDDTVELLLDTSCINMIDIQYAMIIACRNEDHGLSITKLLYECADHSTIDINVVFSAACKNLRIDIVQWIIEMCDKNITVTETSDGNKHLIKSLDKNLIDMDRAFICILNMDTPDQNKENDNKTKNKLVRLILNKSDPSIIHIYKLLAETCKNDWVDFFQWILEKVDSASLNIGEIINVACHNGAFDIIKWSLENIDIHLIDVDNVLVESCGFGWLECVVLIWKHCNQYKLQAAMTEACTYGRLHIAEWLLQNVHYQLLNITMLLKEAGRNGWIKMFSSLLQHFHFDKSDMHTATIQALENGYLEIAELGITKVGKEGFDFSSLSENAYTGTNKEEVVYFLLHNIDHKSIDIATIMTNACLFGWKDVVTFIVDNDLTSLCDLSLGFHTACDNGELEIAQLLLDKVDLHILTTVAKAMHSVAVKGWDEIALLLLDKVEHTRLDIGNALVEACRHGEIDVVQAILQKVDHTLLDVETALDKACKNHMHEDLVFWMLENIDQEQVDLKSVKKQAVRHKWWKVQIELAKIGIEDLNQDEQETETDNIVILE